MKKINHTHNLALLVILITVFGMVLPACQPAPSEENAAVTGQADINYTLKTASEGSRLVFIGVGGEIDGQVNPDLQASVGDTIDITLVNDGGRFHDIVIDEFNAATPVFGEIGQEGTIQFKIDQAGTFFYYCSVSGHRRPAWKGKLMVAAGE